ncbi:MAG: hypothetical protein AAF357_13175 [Verrucomicrobiota bacterium]
MKLIARMIAVAAMASGGLGGYSLTIGKDTRVGMQTKQVIQRVQDSVTQGLSKIAWLELNPESEVIMETYQPVLQACLDVMFFEKNGYHFSQSKWGAQSVPYQFRGLEIVGPKRLTTNGADDIRGIEQRLSFEFYVEAFRTYDKAEGWSNWKIDTAPNLNGITMVLHAGKWKIASSPQHAYNLK